jgi:hypothetical protein
MLPVRACMTANVTLRFLNVYGVPDAAVTDIIAALTVAALTEERAEFFGVEFGFFEGCQGAAAGRLGEPADVRGPFEPGPGVGMPPEKREKPDGRPIGTG